MVKSGGAIEPQGTRITLRITDPSDMTRDVLKSETCSVEIPELEFELGMGALGGKFTTLEGLLKDIRELVERNPFTLGDSSAPSKAEKLQEFIGKLQEIIEGKTRAHFIMDDPAGNSYLQVAEFIDERPNEVKLMEEFRTNAKWKLLGEESRHSETVFRDKSGRKRDLAQERLEQRQKAEAKSERDEQYAKWGKGLAQGRQQQQNVEDAIKEMQKPLARYIDDEDLDRMLREQERDGDPMADFIKKRKAKENKEKKEKPRYNGPAPPLNRFNIWPGHRWDGVDRYGTA
ncbi:hypothetical protein llap_20501 [Limosa lapponica baueri]|uniref:BUD13 homolog n=1 Tax=Limosa lapponica baueri TaxID=1758121 RepID=A0A2I0T5X7_LIMLA|nr:hypothetical protein llap_20501 [Limosa lapponica baueri]